MVSGSKDGFWYKFEQCLRNFIFYHVTGLFVQQKNYSFQSFILSFNNFGWR